MASKLVPPQLDRLDEPTFETASTEFVRPNLRASPRRAAPQVAAVVTPGFMSEAVISPSADPDDQSEAITIEIPRRVKRALLAEVASRRDNPERRALASMKSVILEALAANGFGDFIRTSDLEVQAGIFMKRQSAQIRRR